MSASIQHYDSPTLLLDAYLLICLLLDATLSLWTQCHLFYENHEETIEDWYFNRFRGDDSSGLHNHLCVENAKGKLLK